MLKRGDAGHRLLPKPRKSAPRAAARSRSRSRRKKSTRAAAGARSPSYRSRDSSSHCHRDRRRRGSTGVLPPRPRPPPGEPPPSHKKVAPAPRPPPPLPPAPQPRPRDLAVKPRGSVGVSSKRRRCLESPASPSASKSPQLYIGATSKAKAKPPSKAAADRTVAILKARSPDAVGKKRKGL